VDVAIMGTVALTGIRTPLLLAGSDATSVAEEFAAVGTPARAMVGQPPGYPRRPLRRTGRVRPGGRIPGQ